MKRRSCRRRWKLCATASPISPPKGLLCASSQFLPAAGCRRHCADLATPVAGIARGTGQIFSPPRRAGPPGSRHVDCAASANWISTRRRSPPAVPDRCRGRDRADAAEDMVRQAQKMEAIGHLTGGVAHDFNNLLQIISANLDLAVAIGEAQSHPNWARRLQNAMGAVSRGSRLTGQLLAFARRQALDAALGRSGPRHPRHDRLLRRTLGEQIEVEAVIAGGLVEHAGRSHPGRKRHPQSRHQCARRHAGRRQADPGSRQRLSRRRLCRASMAKSRPASM